MTLEQRTARLTILVDPRKKAVFERLCAEEDATGALRVALNQLLADDARLLADRFRHATKTVDEARDLARWLREGGAFGLAA